MSNNSTAQVLSNLLWRFAERSGTQIIQFIISIILARILTPADYGLIGLITVFISISLVFAQSGLGQALVQKKNADNIDFSTVFYSSLILSILIYIILFLYAPVISGFYNEPQLTGIIRVLGISVIIGAINSVQQAYIQKKLQFKKYFFSTFSGTIVSSVIGIGMAYKGFGVWSLVAQQISSQLLNTIILWFSLEWKPTLDFSIEKMKSLFSFGWKLLCSSLMDTIYNNMYSLIIGRYYSASQLGYYNRGKQFPILIIQNINVAIDSVLFPLLSEVQEDKERLKSIIRRSIVTSTFLIFPSMAGLAAVAEPLVKILLTEKWLPAVPFIQYCCFIYAFWPVHTANLQAIKALGRSDIYLKLEIVKKIIGIALLIITLPFGLHAMMIGQCISTIMSSVVNAFPNKKLLNYSLVDQVRDILPSMLLSFTMFWIALNVKELQFNEGITLLFQGVIGVVVYSGGAKIFRFEVFNYVMVIIKSTIYKMKEKHNNGG